jgi:uncharacterized protein DUF6065
MHDMSTTETSGEPVQGDAPVELPLMAYCTNWALNMPLVAAPRERGWMEATPQRFANRCLPLLIANQAGWLILSGHKVAATWDGGAGLESIRVEHLSGGPPYSAASHFGSGILTFSLPYLFRTPPGFNLLVRGPTNSPKDGISPLDGVVETDWLEATFTMNWKLTRPHHTVVFEVGEPVAMIVPQPRGELECFRPEIRDLADDPELADAFQRWCQSRIQFNAELKQPGSDAQRQRWQKHYFQGASVSSAKPFEHQSKLMLQPFVDRRKSRGA